MNGRYEFYNANITKDIIKKLEMESDIFKGIQKNQFFLMYQPKYSIVTNKITGFEALLRWNTDNGVLTPDRFINVAEESGLIYELNKIIVSNICKDIFLFKKERTDIGPIAINLSGKEFALYNMVGILKEALTMYGLTPNDIEIEITERTLINDLELSKFIFKQLNDLGIKISIDDFGTGFSSIELLLNLPVNSLKIDKKFIDKLNLYGNEYIIVKNIIHMAKELKLKTIAEGVENFQQYEILKNLGCDEIQGFLFAKPMKFDEVLRFLKITVNKCELYKK